MKEGLSLYEELCHMNMMLWLWYWRVMLESYDVEELC